MSVNWIRGVGLSRLVGGFAATSAGWSAPPAGAPAEEAKPAQAKAAEEEEKLEPYQCGKVQRLHTLGGIFLASQPEKDDFTHAKEGGIKTVLNLREKDEMDWDEAALVKSLGLEYVNIPFKAPATLTDDVFEATRKLLGDKEKRPLLVHCASANRVGAVWLAHRVLDDGKSYDEALKEAKTVGLKLPAYEEKTKDYIARMQKKEGAKKAAK
jgi:uncharacterized protein (TIGR01244 family)